MKIVFLNRFFYPDHSATSQLLTDLACHLAKRGFSVLVIASRQTYDTPDAELPSQENVRGVNVTRIWTTRFGRANLLGRSLDYLTFYLSAGWKLLALLTAGDLVIAKTDPPLVSVVAALAAKARGAILVNWIQDLFPEVAIALGMGRKGSLVQVLRSARNWSLRYASKNVVIGEAMAAKLTQEGVQFSAIEVIHNWADGQNIHTVERENNQLRLEWDLHNKFVVGYSGNLGRAHEFDTILDAAEALKGCKNVVFLFIGGGAQRGELEKKVKGKGLTNFLFKPYQPREQLSLSLSAPDLHLISLQPSLEGTIVPSKFYGVAAAGRPTLFIGSLTGEIPRILREARCGFSVEIGQAPEACEIIRVLAEDNETCNDLGKRARALFDQKYDIRHALNTWDTLISSLATSVTQNH